METHAVILKIKMSQCLIKFNTLQIFYASYSIIHFDLFLQSNNFLNHLLFESKFLIHDFIFSDTLLYY